MSCRFFSPSPIVTGIAVAVRGFRNSGSYHSPLRTSVTSGPGRCLRRLGLRRGGRDDDASAGCGEELEEHGGPSGAWALYTSDKALAHSLGISPKALPNRVDLLEMVDVMPGEVHRDVSGCASQTPISSTRQ